MESGLEFGAVVGLDQVDLEGQLLEDVVKEPDGGLLIQAIEDLENPEPSAVIDRGVLVVLLAHALDGLDELDVDLNGVAWALLLVALPALDVALVALRRRQSLRLARLRMRQTPDGLTATS